MADGARFDIDIQTQNLGADATSEQLNELAARITGVDVVATRFDTVVAATTKRLAEASSAAQVAAASLGEAQSRYAGLEREADRAAKALEAATQAGKKGPEAMEKLRAQAVSTAAAMQAQAVVVDKLAVVSKAAAAEQTKLAGTLKTLEAKQKGAADQTKKGGAATSASSESLMTYLHSTIAVARAVAQAGAAAYGAAKGAAMFAIAANPMAMMRLNLASQRLQFSMLKLFRGLDLSRFLGGMDRLGALFDTTNTSGRALKLLIETVMQPLLDAVGKLEPYVGEFFKGLIHGALQVYIAILKIEIAVLKAMSPETRAAIKKLVDRVFTLENAFTAGTVAMEAFAVVVGGVVLIALGACAIAAASFAAALSVIAALAIGVVIAIGLLVAIVALPFVLLGAAIAAGLGKWDDFKKALVKFGKDAYGWGEDIIYGLTGGLAGGSKDLGAQMKTIAATVEGGLKTPLKIHSPSLVTYEAGLNVVAGLTNAMDDGQGDVEDASTGLGHAAAGGIGGGAAGGSTSSTSTRSVHIENLIVHGGDGSPTAIFGAVKQALLEVLEGTALSLGGGEVPSTP